MRSGALEYQKASTKTRSSSGEVRIRVPSFLLFFFFFFFGVVYFSRGTLPKKVGKRAPSWGT